MSETAVSDNGIQLSEQQARRRRARSVAIGLILAAVVVLFYVITVIKLGPGAAVERPL